MFKINKKILLLVISIILISFKSFAIDLIVDDTEVTEQKKEIEPKNTLYIELKDGVVIAELFPSLAPSHVQRIRSLTKDGFYDGLKFHRVIAGFMAQTGDPTGTGRGGSSYGKVRAEFNKEHHIRGTLSMARASDPNSANSQFFIVTGKFFPELDGQYTIFGRVIEGMEYVDNITAGDMSKNGVVEHPDIMIKVLTGDMLNNKPMEVVKQEIEVVNNIQEEELKKDPNYKKKSVLKLLLKSKDIDSTAVEQPQPEKETLTPSTEENVKEKVVEESSNNDAGKVETPSINKEVEDNSKQQQQ